MDINIQQASNGWVVRMYTADTSPSGGTQSMSVYSSLDEVVVAIKALTAPNNDANTPN